MWCSLPLKKDNTIFCFFFNHQLLYACAFKIKIWTVTKFFYFIYLLFFLPSRKQPNYFVLRPDFFFFFNFTSESFFSESENMNHDSKVLFVFRDSQKKDKYVAQSTIFRSRCTILSYLLGKISQFLEVGTSALFELNTLYLQ